MTERYPSAEDVDVALVSNRGPISFLREDEGFETKRGAGGLSGALDPVAARLGDRAIWIAVAISETDRAAVRAGELERLKEDLGYPLMLLEIDPQTYSRYYNVCSNRMLWFANHCLWDELDIKDFGRDELEAWKEAYEPVNDQFARAIADTATGSSWLVLLQDYHLALAPKLVKELCPANTVFHFTHSSFCAEGLERLPEPLARQVVEGMLGADLVGFHVPPWAHSFMTSCERIGAKVDRENGMVWHEGRRSWIRSYPIPIDVEEVRGIAARERTRRWSERFISEREGPLVVRADRAEPSKNVIRGFEAFGRLLDRRPDLEGTRFIACIYPSRESMPEYQRYMEDIERIVEEVNNRHPSAIHLFMKDDYERTLGALRVYDVLLVNSIMDGMNLVSKEGPAINQRDGVVVLSREAGSAAELGDHSVVIEDPLDIEETAAALARALGMRSSERKRRARALRKRVEGRTPGQWIQSQLDDLLEIRAGREPLTPPR